MFHSFTKFDIFVMHYHTVIIWKTCLIFECLKCVLGRAEEGKIQRKNILEKGLTSNKLCREADMAWNIIKSQTEQNWKRELGCIWDLCLFGTMSVLLGQNQSQQDKLQFLCIKARVAGCIFMLTRQVLWRLFRFFSMVYCC